MPHFGVLEWLLILVFFVLFIGGSLCLVLLIAGVVLTGKLAQASRSQLEPSQLTTTPSKENLVEKLEQLKQMLDAGLISAQDYEAKKADILSRM